MNKFAHAYITKLGFSSKKILPMDGAGPVLSDYVLARLGANRSGRAHAMATASGTPENKIPFKIKHPVTSDFGASLGGALGGAVLGGAAGIGLYGMSVRAEPTVIASAAAGSLLGALGLMIANRRSRRSDMRDISKKFDNTPTLSPKPIDPGGISDYLLPFGGFANKGERDTHHYLAGRNKESPHFDTMNVIENVMPYVGEVATPGGSMIVDAASGIAENVRSRHPKKASAMIMHHYLNKRAPLKEKEETRASKVLRGGLAGAAIGGLGLGVTGAGAGVYSSLSDVNAAKRIIESRGIEVPDGTDNNTLVRAYVAGSGLGGGLMGGAAGVVGGGALGILYGMIR